MTYQRGEIRFTQLTKKCGGINISGVYIIEIPDWAIDYTAMSLPRRMAVAIAVGVSERTVGNWARGIGAPKTANEIALRKALYGPRKASSLRVGGKA